VPKLVASSSHNRLVANGTRRIIEVLDHDALGAPTWRRLGSVDLSVSLAAQPLSLASLEALFLIFDAMSEKDRALTATFNYSLGGT
jgi:hypothetical protein